MKENRRPEDRDRDQLEEEVYTGHELSTTLRSNVAQKPVKSSSNCRPNIIHKLCNRRSNVQQSSKHRVRVVQYSTNSCATVGRVSFAVEFCKFGWLNDMTKKNQKKQ